MLFVMASTAQTDKVIINKSKFGKQFNRLNMMYSIGFPSPAVFATFFTQIFVAFQYWGSFFLPLLALIIKHVSSSQLSCIQIQTAYIYHKVACICFVLLTHYLVALFVYTDSTMLISILLSSSTSFKHRKRQALIDLS